jgi:hypothetical protein
MCRVPEALGIIKSAGALSSKNVVVTYQKKDGTKTSLSLLLLKTRMGRVSQVHPLKNTRLLNSDFTKAVDPEVSARCRQHIAYPKSTNRQLLMAR